ncbi:D-2-hydroxyacid dehydrogenase [Sporolactobacillus sp. THM7-4]|nr:D-2-hydroxyacid dehydrogenase [Sporolactobacillus sp. THM7-4]
MKKKKIVFRFNDEFNFPAPLKEKVIQPFADTFEFCEISGNWNIEQIKDAVAFIGWPTDHMIKAMENLQWLQLPSAGANHFANHPLLADDVTVTNSSGVFGVAGGEHIIALMLAFARQIPIHVHQTAEHIWKQNPRSVQIEGSTVAIVGLGDIGSQAAIRLKAFGARVIGIKRQINDKPDYIDALYDIQSIGRVLSESDFVINVLPLTPETRNLFNHSLIMNIKPGAVFINVGRGQTVDEQALAEALKTGHLGGAGLDVTAVEPLPETSPLWDLPNVIITSHSLGITPDKQEKRAALIKENLERFRDGKMMANVVNRKLGY